MINKSQFERLYPVGFKYFTKSAANPNEILGHGEWKTWNYKNDPHPDYDVSTTHVWKRIR